MLHIIVLYREKPILFGRNILSPSKDLNEMNMIFLGWQQFNFYTEYPPFISKEVHQLCGEGLQGTPAAPQLSGFHYMEQSSLAELYRLIKGWGDL